MWGRGACGDAWHLATSLYTEASSATGDKPPLHTHAQQYTPVPAEAKTGGSEFRVILSSILSLRSCLQKTTKQNPNPKTLPLKKQLTPQWGLGRRPPCTRPRDFSPAWIKGLGVILHIGKPRPRDSNSSPAPSPLSFCRACLPAPRWRAGSQGAASQGGDDGFLGSTSPGLHKAQGSPCDLPLAH